MFAHKNITARAPSGAADSGTIRAETRTGAVEQLVRRGYAPLAVDEVRRGPDGGRQRLRRHARERGMRLLAEDGMEKARQGWTTVQEVLRVARQEE